jgi:hypothetical protein
MTKPCPESFIKVGAASVVLRHALFDIDVHFKALAEALEAAHADMKAHGIARMEIAPGEALAADASTAVLKVMCAHDSWRAMLERHGISTPTDDDILAVHKTQKIEAREGSSLKKITTLGNGR